MTKIAILGITGMLGSTVFETFFKSGFDVVTTTRQELDAQKATETDIIQIIKNCEYIINCIGIIKTYIHNNNSYEIQRAVEVNSLFPHRLSNAANNTGSKIIQIATDCVYDGAKGSYSEIDLHNATDVYGKTKSLGEVKADNVLNLRCSIIGKEKKSYVSLLEWFLNQPQNAKVDGYKNHLWNGITTNAFAKICLGLIQNDKWFNGSQHVVPFDTVTKADMLKIFAKTFKREDITINETNTAQSINRTLSTINTEKNEELWTYAGYTEIPTIKQLIGDIQDEKVDK